MDPLKDDDKCGNCHHFSWWREETGEHCGDCTEKRAYPLHDGSEDFADRCPYYDPIKGLTKEQQERRDALEKRIAAVEYPPLPNEAECKKYWEETFSFAPEGDFRYDDVEAGDWSAYRCCDGEEGCSGWSKSTEAVNLFREGGKERIEVMTVDRDGDWDINHDFESWEDPDFAWWCREHHRDEHFRGWAEYWLSCAESGEDPLEQAFSSWKSEGKSWQVFCLDAAEDMVKYLEMGKKKKPVS